MSSRPGIRSAVTAVVLAAGLLAAPQALGEPLPGRASAPQPAAAAGAVAARSAAGDGGPGATEGQPSAEEQAAADRAARLERAAGGQAGSVDAARASLEVVARRAAAALQRYRTAVLARQEAERRRVLEEKRLATARRQVSSGRTVVTRWARQAYISGGGVADSPAVTTLLAGGTTAEIGAAEDAVRRVGDSRARALAALQTAQRAQETAAARARTAAADARAATAEARRAKADGDREVTRQRALLARLEARLGSTRQAAAEASRRAARLRTARLEAARREREAARQRRARQQRGAPAVAPGAGAAGCKGRSLAGHGNGRLPLSALCPLWGAPGARLRADAAAAFDRLSRAYAGEFGAPICVTDSYRSYAAQVDVHRRKPTLAAVPGTSNHGWGTALDLCGGVQSFGTRTHRWMKLHATAHGWFHPSWAEPSGSKPEPWHWEFGG